MSFPERIYTIEEVKRAIDLISQGYKHVLTLEGTPLFRQRVGEAIELIKTAGYHDFFRTYIRSIVEIDGLTQLREADATIWTNHYVAQNPVDAASLFMQKANHMREYLEGNLHYGGAAEARSVRKRIEFLRELRKKAKDMNIKRESERLLRNWDESVFL